MIDRYWTVDSLFVIHQQSKAVRLVTKGARLWPNVIRFGLNIVLMAQGLRLSPDIILKNNRHYWCRLALKTGLSQDPKSSTERE